MTFLNSTDVQHKIVLLGDSSVGKSSVLLRFSKNEFMEEQEPTVGAAFVNHSVNIGTEIKQLQIWDTAGQERFQSLAPMYYRGAKGAIVCYDVTRIDTFHRAKDWVIELKEQGPQNVKIVLCGNKVDLNQQNVKTIEAKQYAEENGLLFYESSAKTGKGIVEMFVGLSKNLPEDLGQTVFKDDFYDDEQLPTIILGDQKPEKKNVVNLFLIHKLKFNTKIFIFNFICVFFFLLDLYSISCFAFFKYTIQMRILKD